MRAAFLSGVAAAAGVFPVPPTCSVAPGGCAAAINAAIEACAGTGAPCAVQLTAGVYNLSAQSSSMLAVTGARDLSLLGAGVGMTTLLLETASSTVTVLASTRVTLSGFTIDSARPFFTLATVASVSGGVSTLSYDATSYLSDEARWPWLGFAQAVIGYDVANDRYSKGGIDDYWTDSPKPITYLTTTGTAASMTIPAVLPMGATLVVRHVVYGLNAVAAYNSDSINVLNVTVLSTPGMGVYTSNCSDTTLDGFIVTKAPGRPMSITADGVHFSNPRGTILVRQCVFDGQGDDGFNAPTIFIAIANVSSDRLTLTMAGRNGVATDPRGLFALGDAVNFFSRSSLVPNGPVGSVASLTSTTMLLALPLPTTVSQFDLINNPGSYATYVEISDTVFRNNRARGALLKQGNVLVTGCTFDHCTGSAMKTETDGCYWMEGHPVSNWTIAGNTITGCNYATATMPGDIEVDNSVPVFIGGVPTTTCTAVAGSPVQSGITISNNTFFQDAGSSAVAMYAAAGVRIEGNIVVRAPSTPVPAFDFGCEGCTDSAVNGNTCNGGACVVTGL
jgi:hypothetical protein